MPRPRKKKPVVLISPPWARLDSPSLTCATLKPALEKAGRKARVAHLGLELAAILGADAYHALADDTHFVGDAAFASLLPRAGKRDLDALCALAEKRYRRFAPHLDAARLRALAKAATKAARALSSSPAVAACARAGAAVFVCDRDIYNQTIAAVAIARRLKTLSPGIATILTGPAVEGPVAAALLEAFPWIDWAAQGDPEAVIPGLLDALETGAPPPKGSASRRAPSDSYGLLADLDSLPDPDFDDYFSRLRALRRRGLLVPEVSLPFEGGRGCWWGAASHCKFCYLNDATIKARVKSGARAAAELARQSRKHRILRFAARDNIMPRGYETDFLPALNGLDLRVFYEMKPRLGRAGVAALAAAGVKEVQPGVETFSTRLLGLSGKGTTATQNVVFMKWARHYGIDLRWYLLHGFPGETNADYDATLRAVALLRHLPPPLFLRRLELQRFSPYFAEPERFGFRKARPAPEYELVLPRSRVDWSRAAHFYEHELDGEKAFAGRVAELDRAVSAWREQWTRPRPPVLECRRGEGFLELNDARSPSGRHDTTILEGDAAWAYDACGDAPLDAEGFARAARAAGRRIDARGLSRSLDGLAGKGLLWSEDGAYFALALPYGRGYKPYDILSLMEKRA